MLTFATNDDVTTLKALVRSMATDLRDMHRWAGPRQEPTPLPHSPFAMHKVNVLPGDTLRFQDFAGILMTNTASMADLNKRMGTTSYPVSSFRSNVVVKVSLKRRALLNVLALDDVP